MASSPTRWPSSPPSTRSWVRSTGDETQPPGHGAPGSPGHGAPGSPGGAVARLSDANLVVAREIMARYPEVRSALIPLCHLAQEQDGWLTEDAMCHVAGLRGGTPAEVLGPPTFYEMLKLEPIGQY